jgi:predicted aspartyl protease
MIRAGLFFGFVLATSFVLPATAQGQEACNLNRFSVVPITTLPDGRFTIPVELDGQKLDFLVDTGGVNATIDQTQAFNLRQVARRTTAELRGVAGDALINYTVVSKFSLGRLQGTNIEAYIDNRLPPGVDGTISADMMKRYDVDIDLLRGTLSLFSQNHCIGQVVYWTRSGYVELPMKVESDGHIQVPVSIDGAQFTALLDTGAQHTIISMRAAKIAGVAENSSDLKLVSDKNAKFKRYDYPFKLLDFNGIAVSRPRIQIVSDDYLPSKDTDLIVGVSILRRLHLYIAYGEEKLYITPALAN